jgi:hypothetical protein
VGSLIKHVKGFCENVLERIPGFKIEIQQGRVRLEHIFLARLWATESDPNDMVVLTYRKLIEVAGETKAEAEFCQPA